MKVKVLLFADRLPPLIGGMEIHARYFIEYFSNHKKFKLIAIVTKDSNGQDALFENGKLISVRLEELKNKFKPDIVFFNSGRWIEELANIRCCFSTARIIYRTGGNEILKAPLVKNNIPSHHERQIFWVDAINNNIDLLVTNSNFTENRLRSIGIHTPFTCCVGGVNAAELYAISKEKSSSNIRMFCAARFVPYKNHKLLIDIVHDLKLRGYKVKLRLAGDGEQFSEIYQHVSCRKLHDSITFLGAIDNLAVCTEICAADVYMQLSQDYDTLVPGGHYLHCEGMGRSFLEAITAGTFVIAGSSGALPEIIDGMNGILVDLLDRRNMVNTIAAALDKLPINLQANDKYSWNNLFKKYETFMLA